MPSFFYLKTDNPANQNLVRDEIHNTRGLSEYQVHTVEEMLSQMTPERLPGFNIALRVVIAIAFIVGFLVIFQSMYTAVLERTREIGILKSLGASKAYIVNVILRETSLFTVAGIIVGLGFTFVIKAILNQRFPDAALSRRSALDDLYRCLSSYRLIARCTLPRMEGRAKRSHRRPRLRIAASPFYLAICARRLDILCRRCRPLRPSARRVPCGVQF